MIVISLVTPGCAFDMAVTDLVLLIGWAGMQLGLPGKVRLRSQFLIAIRHGQRHAVASKATLTVHHGSQILLLRGISS